MKKGEEQKIRPLEKYTKKHRKKKYQNKNVKKVAWRAMDSNSGITREMNTNIKRKKWKKMRNNKDKNS